MDKKIITDKDYKNWLTEVIDKVKSAQVKVAVKVNSALIAFYWELGKMIATKQSESKWGDKIIEQLSKDLHSNFPELKGLSTSNLKYCKRFYLFYGENPDFKAIGQNKGSALIGQQPVDQIPWGHNILVFTKSKSTKEAIFYIQQTIENNWSRDKNSIEAEFALRDINKPMGVRTVCHMATLCVRPNIFP